MRKMLLHNAELLSTMEATKRLVKILYLTYVKEDLEKVANSATHINSEDITQLLSLLKDFEDLFYGTLGGWYTDPVNLELKTDAKPFTCKYYLFPRINKETFSQKI